MAASDDPVGYLCCPALWFQGIGFGSGVIQHAAADWKNGTQDLSSLKNTELVAGLALVFAIHFQKLNIDLMLLVLSSKCQTKPRSNGM